MKSIAIALFLATSAVPAFGQLNSRPSRMTIHAVTGDLIESFTIGSMYQADLAVDLVRFRAYSADPAQIAIEAWGWERNLYSPVYDGAEVGGEFIEEIRRSSVGTGGSTHSVLINNQFAIVATPWSLPPSIIAMVDDVIPQGTITSIFEVSPAHGIHSACRGLLLDNTGSVVGGIFTDVHGLNAVAVTGPGPTPFPHADGFADLGSPSITDFGAVVTYGRVYGPGFDSTNDIGVFLVNASRHMSVVAWKGELIDGVLIGEPVDYQYSNSGNAYAVADAYGNLVRKIGGADRDIVTPGQDLGGSALVEFTAFDIAADGDLLGLASTTQGHKVVRWHSNGQISTVVSVGDRIKGTSADVYALFTPSIQDEDSRYAAVSCILERDDGSHVSAILSLSNNSVFPVIVTEDRANVDGQKVPITFLDLKTGNGATPVRNKTVCYIAGLIDGRQIVVTSPLKSIFSASDAGALIR